MPYFFILGQNPTLSLAEIISVFKRDKISFRIDAFGNNVLIVSFKQGINSNDLLKKLGGTIKIGLIKKELADWDIEATVFSAINDFDLPTDKPVSRQARKIYFGLSLYLLSRTRQCLPPVRDGLVPTGEQTIKKQFKQLGMEIKSALKKQGRISRWVTSKEETLSSVIVAKNKLLTQGMEMAIIPTDKKIYLGQTLAVQEFEEYGMRDYGRPERNARSGMLPPKLAKIMVNLSGMDKSAVILDPFCGSGTILQEALLLGYKNIIGSDKSPKAIADTRTNLEWLIQYSGLTKKGISSNVIPSITEGEAEGTDYKLFVSEILKLPDKIKPRSIDAIITEPYLGPPLTGREAPGRLNQIIKELSKLYLQSFEIFKKILTPQGKIIMALPVFVLSNNSQKLYLNIMREVEKKGFKKINFFEGYDIKDLGATPQSSIIYGRTGQKVWREIAGWKLRD